MKKLLIALALVASTNAAAFDNEWSMESTPSYEQQMQQMNNRLQQLEEQRQDMEFRQMTNDMNPNMPPLPMVPNGLCEAGQLCW